MYVLFDKSGNDYHVINELHIIITTSNDTPTSLQIKQLYMDAFVLATASTLTGVKLT